MSSILYYSNFCNHSKSILQQLSQTQQIKKDIHFMCIDKRVRDPANGKTYIVTENGQKIVMPETITRVPALLLLNENYRIIYGDLIYDYLKPVQQTIVQQSTQNNMEPLAFSLGGGGSLGSGVVSDHFSFLDMDSDDLNAKGNGGLRQMHSYVALNDNNCITTPTEDFNPRQNKLPESMTIEKLQQLRDSDMAQLRR
jgi:hypothetical protein